MASQQMPAQVQRVAVPAGKKPRKKMEAADRDVLLGIILVIIAISLVMMQSVPEMTGLYTSKFGAIPYIAVYALAITAMFSFASKSWPFGLFVAFLFTYFFAIYHGIAVLKVATGTPASVALMDRLWDITMRAIEVLPVAMIGIAAALIRKK